MLPPKQGDKSAAAPLADYAALKDWAFNVHGEMDGQSRDHLHVFLLHLGKVQLPWGWVLRFMVRSWVSIGRWPATT